ncbi:hypothetical protein GO495_20820 [Chitinophaga oryziterrae]|uniref:Uncharacterized protein n=2 Tax=Chitinophaga oryziterrae TaxID=1031224 RepID=A0A6N8JCW2_9BACT|nr:hypothetical protein [Chitinophaga oryziterrae]
MGIVKSKVLVKYNLKRDSAHLNLKLTNEDKLPILTGGVFYAHWTEDHSSILLAFGDVFKIWHQMEYELKSIKPDSSASWDFSVKNFFTDSTTAVLGGG